jgi:hypothetical protein
MLGKSRTPKSPKPRKPRKPLARKPFKASARPRKASGGLKARPRGGKSITHLCGHKQVHVITGPAWKKEREQERLAARVCTNCWAEERAQELEALFDLTQWPELEGTPAQVLWARSIRAEVLLKFQTEAAVLDRERREVSLKPASDRYMAIVAAALFKELRAKWWIDEHEAPGFFRALFTAGDEDTLHALRAEVLAVPPCPF